MKQLTIFLIAICVLTISNAQISLNGPEGCDATYFYKSKVGFWLGTGSSGGIFFSNKIYNSWKPFNDPFGPAHIYWIGEIGDTLITNADNAYYQFNDKNLKWNLVKDSTLLSKCHTVEITSKNNELNSLKNLLGSNTILFLPQDVNALHYYNEDSIIVCTQSGLYTLNITTNKLSTIKTTGVIASDVFQINKSEHFGLITLTQDHCIWNFKNSSWVKLFDLKETEYYKKYFTPINLDTAKSNQVKLDLISSFYPKGFFNINEDGSILLSIMNSLFLINPVTKSNKFIESPINHNVLEAKITNDGKIVATGDFSYNGSGQFIYNKFLYNGKWLIENNIVDNIPQLPVMSNIEIVKKISLRNKLMGV